MNTASIIITAALVFYSIGVWSERFFNGDTVFMGLYILWMVIELRVTRREQQLNVAITPDKERYQPGDTATYTIRTTGEYQRVQIPLSVFPYDEGERLLSHADLDTDAQGTPLCGFGIGGAWQLGATIRIDELRVRF